MRSQTDALGFSGRPLCGSDRKFLRNLGREGLGYSGNKVCICLRVQSDEYVRLVKISLDRNILEGFYIGMGEYDVSCIDVPERNRRSVIVVRPYPFFGGCPLTPA